MKGMILNYIYFVRNISDFEGRILKIYRNHFNIEVSHGAMPSHDVQISSICSFLSKMIASVIVKTSVHLNGKNRLCSSFRDTTQREMRNKYNDPR